LNRWISSSTEVAYAFTGFHAVAVSKQAMLEVKCNEMFYLVSIQ